MPDQGQKDKFVVALTELGGSAGNTRLRDALQWDEATYNAVKDDLVAEGVVTLGRGRGGSVSLGAEPQAEAEEAAPVAARAKPKRAKRNGANGNETSLGFEAQLFLAADKLRKNLEPSDYKHVVLGLIFLRHISQTFEAKREALLAEDEQAAEDPDEYLAEKVFWVPKEARCRTFRPTPGCPPSASSSTRPCWRSRRRTRRSRACCRRTTTARPSTR